MDKYLVTLLIAYCGYERTVTDVVIADDEDDANRSAYLGEAHNVDEENIDDILGSLGGEYLEDDGFAYSIEKTEMLQVVDGKADGKDVKILVPKNTHGFYTRETLEHKEGNYEKPYCVSLKWLVDGYEKSLEEIEWAKTAADAKIQALIAQSSSVSDDDDEKEEVAKIMRNGGEYLSDDSGDYRADWASELTIIDFEIDGNKYAALGDMLELNATHAKIVFSS